MDIIKISSADCSYQEHLLQWDTLSIFARLFSPSKSALVGRGLLLHGGEGSSSERTVGFCRWMAHYGIQMASFDFEGQGRSTGALMGSSLKRRRDLAAHAVNTLLDGKLDLTLGFSMGGPTALDLAVDYPKFGIKQVFFVCAAQYASSAFTVPFGPEFKMILNTTDSWKDSDVTHKASMFQGSIYVVTSEEENVIPSEITNMMLEAAQQCRACGYIKIPGTTHKLSSQMQENDILANNFARLISSIYLINKPALCDGA